MADHRGDQVLDALVYALAVTVVSIAFGVVVIAIIALLTKGTLSGIRWLYGLQWVLFLLGFLTMGLGALKLRPPPAWKDDPRLGISDSRRDTPLQRAVQRLPPLAGREIESEDRFSDGAKLLIASAVMFVTLFLLGVAQTWLA